MHGFRDNEILLQGGFDVNVIYPLGSTTGDFNSNGFCKRDHDFPIAFHSTFSAGMHGFRDNAVLMKFGYDVIVIYPLGGASGDLS